MSSIHERMSALGLRYIPNSPESYEEMRMLEAKTPITLTPLHFAVIYSNIPMIKLLLEKGNCDLEAKHQGKTALELFLAESFSHLAPREKRDLLELFRQNRSALSDRIPEGSYRFLDSDLGVMERAFSNTLTHRTFLPIHLAAMFGNTEMIRQALDQGVNPNIKYDNKNSPLELLAGCSKDLSSESLKASAALLIERGATLTQEILDLFRERGHQEIVSFIEASLQSSLYLSPLPSSVDTDDELSPRSPADSPRSVHSSTSIESPVGPAGAGGPGFSRASVFPVLRSFSPSRREDPPAPAVDA